MSDDDDEVTAFKNSGPLSRLQYLIELAEQGDETFRSLAISYWDYLVSLKASPETVAYFEPRLRALVDATLVPFQMDD